MPRPDITVEAYLQRWTRQGFTAPAAVAHLAREVHEGYIAPPFPSGTHIIAMDGRFFVEAAYGPPAPATNYICRERTRAERIEFLYARDRPAAPASDSPPPEPAPVDIDRTPPSKPKRKSKRASRGPTSLTPEQIERAIAIARDYPELSVKKIREKLDTEGIRASKSTIYRLVFTPARDGDD